MDDSGFIVPPPGLIPPKPAAAAAAATPAPPEAPAPVRPLPAFTPPTANAPAAPARPVWRLILPGGRSVPITRDVLLGRNPSRAAHPETTEHPDPELITLGDPTSTVSKTHALLTPDGDALTVTDLHSTNGIVVAGARVEPGIPTAVPDGATLLLGDLGVRLQRF
jgi:pSer/pThr/pTyr-binding forkhead associated (FHA) protein